MMRELYTSMTGVQEHQKWLDVIGNNVANVNSVGFKQTRVTFQDILSQRESYGVAPQDGQGGVNPKQIGLGVANATMQVMHTQGSMQATGKTTDLAMDGEGFFVMNDGKSSDLVYTRAGAFDLDANGTLVNPANGFLVQGWTAKTDAATGANYVDTSEKIGAIRVDKEDIMAAKATENVDFKANLNAQQNIAIDKVDLKFTAPIVSTHKVVGQTEAGEGTLDTTRTFELAGFDNNAGFLDLNSTVTINNYTSKRLNSYASIDDFMDEVNASSTANVTMNYISEDDVFQIKADIPGGEIKLAENVTAAGTAAGDVGLFSEINIPVLPTDVAKDESSGTVTTATGTPLNTSTNAFTAIATAPDLTTRVKINSYISDALNAVGADGVTPKYATIQDLLNEINASEAAGVTMEYDVATRKFNIKGDNEGTTVTIQDVDATGATGVNNGFLHSALLMGATATNEEVIAPTPKTAVTEVSLQIEFRHLFNAQDASKDFYSWQVIDPNSKMDPVLPEITSSGDVTENPHATSYINTRTMTVAQVFNGTNAPDTVAGAGTITINNWTSKALNTYTSIDELMTEINNSDVADASMSYDARADKFTIKANTAGADLKISQNLNGDATGFFTAINMMKAADNNEKILSATGGVLEIDRDTGYVVNNFKNTEAKINGGNGNGVLDLDTELPDATNDDWVTKSDVTGRDYFTLNFNGNDVAVFVPNDVRDQQTITFAVNMGEEKEDIAGTIQGDTGSPVTAKLKGDQNHLHTTARAVYDSLGVAHKLEFVFEKLDTNKWLWYTMDPVEKGKVAGYGTMIFNNDGTLNQELSTTFQSPADPKTFDDDGGSVYGGSVGFQGIYFDPPELPYDNDQGGSPPNRYGANRVQIAADFSQVVQFAAVKSDAFANAQDGYGKGSLLDISINGAGVVNGIYSNGQNQAMAQLAVATFNNNSGLDKLSGTMFKESADSGEAKIGVAGDIGKGKIASGKLEMSNVDLTEEFVKMIVAERGFTANNRALTTADRIIQEVFRLRP
ncbi:MAG: flagellar hook-basal body complex protein [bacterium]|nr:flagellar hook-basal body complex protein [bacterium]